MGNPIIHSTNSADGSAPIHNFISLTKPTLPSTPCRDTLRGTPLAVSRNIIASVKDAAAADSAFTGVGNKKNPVSFVRGTKGTRRKAIPFRIVPALGQLDENSIKPPNKQSCDVFHDNESWSKCANDSGELKPKTRPLTVKPLFASCAADVLAWESSADNIDLPIFGGRRRKGSHVVPSANMGPVLCEDSLTEWVDFTLPPAFHSGPFKAEIKSADASEQGAERQSH
jgi:hypothetical protein